MLIEKCNRCRKDVHFTHYKFKIEEKSISGSGCMNKFIEFIKEGKK